MTDEELYDTDLLNALHMALGCLPLICVEIVEYVMLDRVLRQFGILQHIPEPPVDMGFLQAKQLSNSQRTNHTVELWRFRDEWQLGGPMVWRGGMSQ